MNQKSRSVPVVAAGGPDTVFEEVSPDQHRAVRLAVRRGKVPNTVEVRFCEGPGTISREATTATNP